MAIIVSFINMKGGVGKTTLAMQITLAACNSGKRVLAVDLDPQANLSQALLGAAVYRKHLKENKNTIIQVFEGYAPPGQGHASTTLAGIDDVIIPIPYRKNLSLVPSRLELGNTLRNPAGKERRLAKALARVSNNYDLIVIDCAPTDSVLTDAAYHSSRYVFVPIKPEFMATIGLPLLAKSLKVFKTENEDHEIDILGIIFVHSSTYTSGPEGRRSILEVTDYARSQGWPILESNLRYSASVAKAAREGTTVSSTSYARWSAITNVESVKNEIFKCLGL